MEILDPKNLSRLMQELSGMRLVVLCGNRAAYLAEVFREAGFNVARCSHTSNQGLVSKHNAAATGGSTPGARTTLRLRAWAACLLEQIRL